ncbi:MAG TPA: alpha/beta fold hydrolase [Alphaproteobacteria bacterium]|nr:alpha/beta fold hydrolase [Alphaproteobacteria bacterium]
MTMPILLVPGLACSPRLFGEQIPALWRLGPVMVADHTHGETISEIAAQILASAPPRFALVGMSMGGYIAFEIMRQAKDRVSKLALIDTSARADTSEATEQREAQIRITQGGKFAAVIDAQFARMVHPSHREDEKLKAIVHAMADDVGPDVFVRQQKAIIARPDSRPSLAAIRCPTLVIVGEADEITPPDRAAEMAEGISGARLVTLKNCGHLTTHEDAAGVNRSLAALLQA